MKTSCPHCQKGAETSTSGTKTVRFGSYTRLSDAVTVQRYRCLGCRKSFSEATLDPCYRQKKRQINEIVRLLLASVLSQRRFAKIYRVHRTTVVRKFLFMAKQAKENFDTHNEAAPKASIVQFDDLETFEHTKLKPLSVTLAVERGTRRILGFEISRMRPKRRLIKKSQEKYGHWPDTRREGRRKLFAKLKGITAEQCIIQSDKNPHYEREVRDFFPDSLYQRFKGRKPVDFGQGELKRGNDPLFELNHTCAMLRANINRLIRKTWCTTKSTERFVAHLYLYADYHNQVLIKKKLAA